MSALTLAPCTLSDARRFVAAHHRRLPVAGAGHLWSVAAVRGTTPVGVAIVGRPPARHLDDGRIVEVTRLATDGTPNACSLLLAAVWRAARAHGYTAATTMTDADEGGASLRAANWVAEPDVRREWRGRGWESRPGRTNPHAAQRLRWWAPGSTPVGSAEPVVWPDHGEPFKQERLPLLPER